MAKMRDCNSSAVRTRKSLGKFVEGAVASGMRWEVEKNIRRNNGL